MPVCPTPCLQVDQVPRGSLSLVGLHWKSTRCPVPVCFLQAFASGRSFSHSHFISPVPLPQVDQVPRGASLAGLGHWLTRCPVALCLSWGFATSRPDAPCLFLSRGPSLQVNHFHINTSFLVCLCRRSTKCPVAVSLSHALAAGRPGALWHLLVGFLSPQLQGLLVHTGQFGQCHPFLAGCHHLPVFSISLVLNMTGLSD